MKPDFPIKRGQFVVLTKDLTKYHKLLTKGCRGLIIGYATQALYNEGYNNQFVKVEFEGIAFDILWKSIEYI